ncbi:uncharacterized protein LTR77_001828 [Saxophila tyrrhenica]|uniref:Uncharacterized protein n=1 Tax=Saxophila tyrrhenica TaxID=1690608 RepID=A0AAV9PLB4_9PEZI|nr:hypothetical protein LTR77_001828 [Saxophila tyrrhenica]
MSLHGQLGLHDQKVLDGHAWGVQEALAARDVSVPSALRVSHLEHGVYHFLTYTKGDCVTAGLADILWHRGFRDVEMRDVDGRKPIDFVYRLLRWTDDVSRQLNEHTRLATWLLHKCASQGGDPTLRDCREILAASLGWLAGDIYGYEMEYGRFSIDSTGFHQKGALDEQTQLFMERIFDLDQQTSHTECACPCSVGGCAAIDRFFRVDGRGGGEREIGSSSKSARRVWFLGQLLDQESECWTKLVLRIIRAVAFNDFGLDHTCFSISWWQVTDYFPEWDGELLDKHRPTRIERFERLLPKLLSTYETSRMDLAVWVDGPMQDLIKQALRAERYPKEVYEITGIVLEEVEDDDDEDSVDGAEECSLGTTDAESDSDGSSEG